MFLFDLFKRGKKSEQVILNHQSMANCVHRTKQEAGKAREEINKMRLHAERLEARISYLETERRVMTRQAKGSESAGIN